MFIVLGKSSDRDQARELRLVVEGFLQGDSAQFRVIRTKINQYVYHQRFGSDVDRDELVSECIEILYDNLRQGKFKGTCLAELNVYIYTTIRFRINRVLRRRSRLIYDDQPAALEVSERSTPEQSTAAIEMIAKIMAKIDEKCRRLLFLKFQEEWSDQEIADDLRMSKNATSTAISRCLKKARELDIVKEAL